MSAPVIDRLGQALSFRWDQYLLTCVLDRFRESRSGDLQAEFTASTSAPGYEPYLTSAIINLGSIRVRNDFVKRMQLLYPEAPWETVLETICAWGLRIHREGEPVVRLSSTTAVQPPQQLLSPLVYHQQPTVIFGAGGTGKSLLALVMALAVEAGTEVAGLQASARGTTLYLDFESDERDLQYRAHLLRKGHPEFAGAEPLYRRSYVPLADDLHALHEHVARSEVRLLVVDSLALAAGCELEKADAAIRTFAALRTLGVASLIVAHPPKDADKASIFGSVFFHNLSRNVWELTRIQEPGESMIEIGLFHRKSNLSRLQRPMGLRLQFGDAITIARMELTEQPLLAKHLTLKTRLQHAMKQGTKSPQELSEELNVEVAQIRARLSEGRGKWSTKLDGDRWGLLQWSA